MKVAEAGEKVNSEKIIILFVYYNLIFKKEFHINILMVVTLKPLSQRLTF